MTMNRRTFLKSLGLGSAAFALQNVWTRPLVAATETIPRNFVFCYCSGGWDTMLCLDPRDPNQFSESDLDLHRIQPAYDRLPAGFDQDVIRPNPTEFAHMTFGPAMKRFAMEHYRKCCLIRGIAMDTVTHAVGKRYFLTGKMPQGLAANGSSVSTRIVAQQGELRAIPSLVARTEAYNQGHPVFSSAVSINSVEDLVTVLQDGPDAPPAVVRRHLDAFRDRQIPCDPALNDKNGFLSWITDSQNRARALVGAGLNEHFKFTDRNDDEMVAIKERYDISNLRSSQAQAAMAYQALKYGIAQTVTIELTSGLDTHDESWADDHPELLQSGFDALAQLVTDLETTDHPQGGKLLDHTTILCFSEFGRGSTINARGGRDHSIASSAMLVGANVPQGKVVGATSDDGMNARAINPDTGEAVGNGTTLTPTLIHASVMEAAGYDTTDLRVSGLPCLMES